MSFDFYSIGLCSKLNQLLSGHKEHAESGDYPLSALHPTRATLSSTRRLTTPYPSVPSAPLW